MADTGRAAGEEQRYEDAVAEFGPALEHLAGAYERDPDRGATCCRRFIIALWRSLARFVPPAAA